MPGREATKGTFPVFLTLPHAAPHQLQLQDGARSDVAGRHGSPSGTGCPTHRWQPLTASRRPERATCGPLRPDGAVGTPATQALPPTAVEGGAAVQPMQVDNLRADPVRGPGKQQRQPAQSTGSMQRRSGLRASCDRHSRVRLSSSNESPHRCRQMGDSVTALAVRATTSAEAERVDVKIVSDRPRGKRR